jgi:hypothetical protein
MLNKLKSIKVSLKSILKWILLIGGGGFLTGEDAYNWDANMLLREQQTIDPSYWDLSNNSLNILEGSLRKKSIPTAIIPFPKFRTSILSVVNR